MAYQRKSDKNGWVLFLFILVGIVLGGFIGKLTSNISFLNWLDFGYSFGVNSSGLDLKVVKFSFEILFNITISSLLGVAIAVFAYKKL